MDAISRLSVTSGGTVSSGQNVTLSSGNSSGVTVLSGGVLSVTGAAVVSAISVQSGANVYVANGGIVSSGVVSGQGALLDVRSGGTAAAVSVVGDTGIPILRVEAGGTAISAYVSGANPVLQVYGGTAISAQLVGSGAGVDVRSGGVASGSVASGVGANVTVSSGASISSHIGSGGSLVLRGAGVDSGTVVSAGGAGVIYNGASMSNTVFQGASTLQVSGGTLTNVSVMSGATENVYSGASVSNTLMAGATLNIVGGASVGTTVASGVTENVTSGYASGNTIQSGGVLNVTSAGTLSGTTTLANGATASITASAGGVINLAGSTNVGLTINGLANGGAATTQIQGFDGQGSGASDGIVVAGVKASDITAVSYSDANHVVLTTTSGKTITLYINGVQSVGYSLVSDSSGNLIYETCFLAGSMIRTPKGDLPVEDLKIGDEIVTLLGGVEDLRSVVWVGSKKVIAEVGRPVDQAGYPIRILRNAIADGVPYKDMLITPEHGLLFDGNFVPARMLVNDRSVFYDRSITEYEYYHVETEKHSVIVADGAPTESYLDTGNRQTFRQHGPVARLGGKPRSWANDGAAPLEVRRHVVEPIFRRIEERAVKFQHDKVRYDRVLTGDADLHLVTDRGQMVRKSGEVDGVISFKLPSDTKSVRLVSRTSKPSDVIGPFVDDRRELGVLVGEISVSTGASSYSLDEHLFNDDLSGWEVVETSPRRWTNGNALIRLASRTGQGDILSVRILAAGPYVLEPRHDEALIAAVI
ncbi:Hint domain-containing protein [Acetobacter sacchari]|uniref:Hint domain-containing protein n=1 Tax=Acetobacter sacchari TaxID=2661687 RepID=A0ABS3LRR4_9PROT|nr:Hint domain-containing protein [Acetobacter sacchari]MBO1358591.1 Hint domain-containing protein [Acetobacter sacchari]